MNRFQAKGFAMAQDLHYIPAFSIEDVLLDKDTGQPLSGGKVYFYRDSQRGVLKPVYQITGTSPNYTFVPLTNPVVLSSIGTFEDALGNPVIPYFYPYDAQLNPDYYYVVVESSDGVQQFTRQAQPYIGMNSSTSSSSGISNEISNPQFALVNFDTSAGAYTYTLGAGSNQQIDFAWDWSLIASVAVAGTVTVEQLKPAGSLNIPTNPGTILSISSTGLSSLILRRRYLGSPNLWGSGYISASFVAKTYSGTAVNLNMYYSQSNGSVTNQQFLPAASLSASGNYQQFYSTNAIPISNSSDTFPNGYIDIYFDIPLGIKIDLTSIMVAFTGTNAIAQLQYEQESSARQVDHLYHTSFPIVPVGAIIDFAGFNPPTYYLECDGAAYNRIQFYQLFNTVTKTETVNLTATVNTFTVANSNFYYIGMPIEGIGIAPVTTITNIVGNTLTISNAATMTISSSVRFFIAGAGDGSTTFNVPDLRGYVLAGAGVPSGFSLLSTYGAGSSGGSNTHTLQPAELPPHSHTYTNAAAIGTSYTFAGGALLATNNSATTGNGPGSSTPFNIIQPTQLMRKCIRYQ